MHTVAMKADYEFAGTSCSLFVMAPGQPVFEVVPQELTIIKAKERITANRIDFTIAVGFMFTKFW